MPTALPTLHLAQMDISIHINPSYNYALLPFSPKISHFLTFLQFRDLIQKYHKYHTTITPAIMGSVPLMNAMMASCDTIIPVCSAVGGGNLTIGELITAAIKNPGRKNRVIRVMIFMERVSSTVVRVISFMEAVIFSMRLAEFCAASANERLALMLLLSRMAWHWNSVRRSPHPLSFLHVACGQLLAVAVRQVSYSASSDH